MAASRAVYILLKGDFDSRLLVRHTCDNRKCVNPAHLVLGTHKDNTDDMFSRGRASPTRGFLRWRPTDKDGKLVITEAMRVAGTEAIEGLVGDASAEELAVAVYEVMTRARLNFVNYIPKGKHNTNFIKGAFLKDTDLASTGH